MKPTINENGVCVSEYTIVDAYCFFDGCMTFTGVVKDKYGTIAHYLDGKIHRDNGPAIEWADGLKEWYMHNERHRKDGPAIEEADGTRFWYLNGECYGIDGDFTNESWISFLATLT